MHCPASLPVDAMSRRRVMKWLGLPFRTGLSEVTPLSFSGVQYTTRYSPDTKGLTIVNFPAQR